MITIDCPRTEKKCSNFFKRGFADSDKHRQRYQCRDCGFLTVGERDKSGSIVPPTMKCKKCSSKLIVGYGRHNPGKQRYKCKNCGITFSYNNPNYDPRDHWMS